MSVLVPCFFVVATLYSMVGFGGGSSYLALLVLFKIPYQEIPIIALLCNISVSSIAAFYFIRGGYFRWKLFLPYAIPAIPFAFFGGNIAIEKQLFFFLLAICLFVAGLRLIFLKQAQQNKIKLEKRGHIGIGLGIGSLLGFISGMVGIGGGIFNLCSD